MIIADTGFWLALANKNDNHHERAKKVLLGLNEPLMTTWPVITETCHLLLYHLGLAAQLAFIKSYNENAFQVFQLTEKEGHSLYRLMKKYHDLPMDLADASLVIVAEQLGEERILSTDQRDFKTYRFKDHKPFKNILFEENF